MTPAESILAWDRARVFTEDALKSLIEIPFNRSNGDISSEKSIEKSFEIIKANLTLALKEVKKLRGNTSN